MVNFYYMNKTGLDYITLVMIYIQVGKKGPTAQTTKIIVLLSYITKMRTKIY